MFCSFFLAFVRLRNSRRFFVLVSAAYAALGEWVHAAADARACVDLNAGYTKGEDVGGEGRTRLQHRNDNWCITCTRSYISMYCIHPCSAPRGSIDSCGSLSVFGRKNNHRITKSALTELLNCLFLLSNKTYSLGLNKPVQWSPGRAPRQRLLSYENQIQTSYPTEPLSQS